MAAGESVLVTGGSGFLGRSVVAALAGGDGSDGPVVSADLRIPDSDQQVPGVVYETVDVTDRRMIGDLFGGHRIGTVVHLASIVNPGRDTTPEREYEVDVDGSRNVLDASVEHGVGRVVVSSSGAAYGYHADSPVPLVEADSIRGNRAFPYSFHKRLVEEMLAGYRETNPELEQVVLRIGTILGETVDNQITALFRRDRLLKVRGSETPFVFIWDEDVAAIIARAAGPGPPGIFNVAGDGTVTLDLIAEELGKSTITVPAFLIKTALFVGNRLGRTPHGPAQVDFLRYRPVLDNTRLKEVFGYTPKMTSLEAFTAWREAQGL
ncbi:MAG: SDR family oxidoreductase [Solirubrobacterales bacterium]